MKKHLSLWRQQLGIKGAITMTVIVLLAASVPVWTHAVFAAPGDTTAWQNGRLVMDTAGVVQRSNIVLQAPDMGFILPLLSRHIRKTNGWWISCPIHHVSLPSA